MINAWLSHGNISLFAATVMLAFDNSFSSSSGSNQIYLKYFRMILISFLFIIWCSVKVILIVSFFVFIDQFNGSLTHLVAHDAKDFVVTNKESSAIQKLKTEKGWEMQLLSCKDTIFGKYHSVSFI
jgi:hypothetical protein